MSNNQTKSNTSSAMTGNILRAANIDMNKFVFEEPQVNKYGGKSCNVKYSGEWKDNFYWGEGSLFRPNNSLIYEGMFKRGRYHGQGKSFLENGVLYYEGEYYKGIRHG